MKTLIRIICTGNRFFAPDSGGPKVFDILSGRTLPEDVELIDGGFNGLNILHLLEQVQVVIFVDNIAGFPAPGGVVVLEHPEDKERTEKSFGPNTGLGELLSIAPLVLDPPLPRFFLVGIEGQPTDTLCLQAADECCALISRLECTIHNDGYLEYFDYSFKIQAREEI